MFACPALAPPSEFLGSVMYFIDCQARSIGAGGYQALASPGSSLSLILTGLLSVFVALFGYRMLLGHTPSVREGVLALVKVGLVLALATGWTAYRTLVYDVAFDAPAQLAVEVGRPSGLVGDRNLTDRLQLVDRSLVELAIAGTGELNIGNPSEPGSAYRTAPPPFAGFDAFALGSARAIYLASAIGSLGSVRVIAGLLLALGPLFVAFLLFEGTRGFFEGWLRVLAGAALGAFGAAMALAVELGLIEPRLADWLARRAADVPVPGAAVELLAITMIFALTLLAILFASARVAWGFRLPRFRELEAFVQRQAIGRSESHVHTARPRESAAAGATGRVEQLADAIATTQRRESSRLAVVAGEAASSPSSSAPSIGAKVTARERVPLGRSFRPVRTRISASAGRRDRRA